jgi:hypothetical protein
MPANYLLGALAGTVLPMASSVIFSSLWGIATHEWKGAGARAKTWLLASLAVPVSSAAIVGWGNYLK